MGDSLREQEIHFVHWSVVTCNMVVKGGGSCSCAGIIQDSTPHIILPIKAPSPSLSCGPGFPGLVKTSQIKSPACTV